MSVQYGINYFANQTVFDKVTPDMIDLVDPYWKQFPPMNPLWHSILAFVLSILTFVALSGNWMVCYIFLSTKSLRSPSNLLVVNLAFSDFMTMITMGPPMVYNCIFETWVLGPLACTLYGMVGSLFGCVSIWTMVLIAMDRYNVIVKGLAAKPMTSGRALGMLFIVWLAAGVWTVLPLFGWGRYVPEGNMTACGTDYITKTWMSRSYIIVYSAWAYFSPLLLIIYFYSHILKAVGVHESNMRAQAKKMNVASLRSDNKNASVEAKLAKVALTTITLWFMAWTPYLIINYMGIFDAAARLNPVSTIWGSLFAKTGSVYNPIVYGISHPRYRAALYKKFPSLSCNETTTDTATTSGISVSTVIPMEEKAEEQ